MSYTVIKKLPSIDTIIKTMPLSADGHQRITQDRQEVKNILEGKDNRLLMIIGPCSAWPKESVLEYAVRLNALNKKISHALKIIMRVYIQKPRTTKGWTGPVNQPDPFSKPDIEAGMHYAREMMLRVIDMGLPIADEAVFTHNAKGFLELLSWVAIGARSSEDQEHRIFASMLDCAVGIKNPTHGSLLVATNSVVAAQHSHVTVMDDHEIKTHGNPHAHVVLRGNHYGSNYSIEDLLDIKRYMDVHRVIHPSVIIDTSHGNCMMNGKKNPSMQPNVIMDVISSVKHQPALKNLVKGFMVESFLKEGNQSIDECCSDKVDLSGLSITDPCLSWEQTEKMLLELVKTIEQ